MKGIDTDRSESSHKIKLNVKVFVFVETDIRISVMGTFPTTISWFLDLKEHLIVFENVLILL